MKSFVVLIIALLSLLSCCDTADNPVGGPCYYNSFEGVATIRSVTSRTEQNPYYEDVVIIIFDFMPDDTSAVDDYRFPDWPDTSLRFDTEPPRAWVNDVGLTVGTEHRCTRNEITDGTCTPVCFGFTDIDEFGWVTAYRKKP